MGLAVLGERAYLRTLRSACSGAAQAEALWVETDVSPTERLRFDGHWNRAGHLEIGRRVHDALSRAGWLRAGRGPFR